MSFIDAGGVCLILVKQTEPVNPVLHNSEGVHHSFTIAPDKFQDAIDRLKTARRRADRRGGSPGRRGERSARLFPRPRRHGARVHQSHQLRDRPAQPLIACFCSPHEAQRNAGRAIPDFRHSALQTRVNALMAPSGLRSSRRDFMHLHRSLAVVARPSDPRRQRPRRIRLSQQARPHRRALCGRRLGRSDRAADRRPAVAEHRPERLCREPSRRWRQYRHRGGRARAAGRLHAAGYAVGHRGQSFGLQQGPLQSRQGPDADCAGQPQRHDRAGRARSPASTASPT